MLQQVGIVINIIGMIIAFASAFTLLYVRATEARSRLLVATLSLIVYHAANYIKPHFANADLYIYLQMVIYISTIAIVYDFLYALYLICDVKLPFILSSIRSMAFVFFCAAIVSIDSHDLWFSGDLSFRENPGAPGLYIAQRHEGWLYYVINVMLLVLAAILIIGLLVSVARRKGRKTFYIRAVAIAMALPVAATAMSFFLGFPTDIVNFTFFTVINVASLILASRYDIAASLADVKEAAVEASDDAIVIMDRFSNFRFANRAAVAIFPQLSGGDPDMVSYFVTKNLLPGVVSISGRKYEIIVRDERGKQKQIIGRLITVRDITKHEERMERIALRSDMANHSYRMLLSNETQTRKLAHELKHHMVVLQGMMASGDTDGTLTYLNSLINEKESEMSGAYSKNLVINALVGNYVRAAASEGITMAVQVSVPESMGFEDKDLCMVVANVLENAVEAAAKSYSGTVDFKAKYNGGYLFIECSNSWDGRLQKDTAGNILTSKPDKGSHGLGIGAVRQVAEKYGGRLEIDSSRERFVVKVIMIEPEDQTRYADQGNGMR